jgi:hypothetical protein
MALFLIYLLRAFALKHLLLFPLKRKLKEMPSLILKNQKMQIKMRPVLQAAKVQPIMKCRPRHQKRLRMIQKCKMSLIRDFNTKHLFFL